VKLIDALELVRRPTIETAPEMKILLACGFTPLHLPTFLVAEVRVLLPENRVSITTGLYGDLLGNGRLATLRDARYH